MANTGDRIVTRQELRDADSHWASWGNDSAFFYCSGMIIAQGCTPMSMNGPCPRCGGNVDLSVPDKEAK